MASRPTSALGLAVSYGTVLFAPVGPSQLAVAQWTVVHDEDWSDADPDKTVDSSLQRCTRGHPGSAVILDLTSGHVLAERWFTGKIRSTAIVRKVGPDVVVITVDVPLAAADLEESEADQLAQAVVRRMTAGDARQRARAAAEQVLADALAEERRWRAASVTSLLVGRDASPDDGPTRDNSCLPPAIVYMQLAMDPPVRDAFGSTITGSVVHPLSDAAFTADRSASLSEVALQMGSSAEAHEQLVVWHTNATRCNGGAPGAERLVFTTERPLSDGYGVDLRVLAPIDGALAPTESPDGPITPHDRTVYLGQRGAYVVAVTVEGVARHPELGPDLLKTALDRLVGTTRD